MSTKTNLPDLPKDTAQTLMALKGSPDFTAYVYALKNAGWTLRAIGAPFGVSRTAVSLWIDKYDGEELPEVPGPPAKPRAERTRPEKYTLSVEEARELSKLAESASRVRRYTDRNSPARAAARALEDKLSHYVDLGVTKRKLAEHCGVSESSVKQRLRKVT